MIFIGFFYFLGHGRERCFPFDLQPGTEMRDNRLSKVKPGRQVNPCQHQSPIMLPAATKVKLADRGGHRSLGFKQHVMRVDS